MGAPFDQSQRIFYSAANIVAGQKPKGYLGEHEKPCKCGVYIADEMTGICYLCERKNAKPFLHDDK